MITKPSKEFAVSERSTRIVIVSLKSFKSIITVMHLFAAAVKAFQRVFTCSKLTKETPEQSVKSVQKLKIKTPEDVMC